MAEAPKSAEDYHGQAAATGDKATQAVLDAYKASYTGSLQPALAQLKDKISKYEAATGQTAPASWLLQQDRYNKLVYQVSMTLGDLKQQVAGIVEDAKGNAVDLAQHAAVTLTGSLASLPPGVVEGIVKNSTFGDSPLGQLIGGVDQDVAAGIKRALVDHAVLGRSVDDTAKEIQGVMGKSLTDSLRIARTETARAYTDASLETYRAAPSGMVDAWRWLTAEDELVCPYCGSMANTLHPLEDAMDTHPNCRCAVAPVVNDAFKSGQDDAAAQLAAQVLADQQAAEAASKLHWQETLTEYAKTGGTLTESEFAKLTFDQQASIMDHLGGDLIPFGKSEWSQYQDLVAALKAPKFPAWAGGPLAEWYPSKAEWDGLTTAQKHELAAAHGFSIGNKSSGGLFDQLTKQGIKAGAVDPSLHPGPAKKGAKAEPPMVLPKDSKELNALPHDQVDAVIFKLTGKHLSEFASVKDAWIEAKKSPEWLAQNKPAAKPAYTPSAYVHPSSLVYPPKPGEHANSDYTSARAWADNYWYANSPNGPWTGAQRSAIAAYTGSSYTSMNANSRKGNVTPTMRNLDSALEQHPTPVDVAVFRGTGLSAFGGGPPVAGQTIMEPGYMSTGASAGSAWSQKKAIITFHVPAGTPGAYVDPVSSTRGENEFLIGRNQTYVINDVRYENGKYYVDATIITKPKP